MPGISEKIGSRVQPTISPRAERISITLPAFLLPMMRRFIPSSLFQHFSLLGNQLTNAAPPKFEKLVKRGTAERKTLGCSLDLHELVAIGHHEIEIHIRAGVFHIV